MSAIIENVNAQQRADMQTQIDQIIQALGFMQQENEKLAQKLEEASKVQEGSLSASNPALQQEIELIRGLYQAVREQALKNLEERDPLEKSLVDRLSLLKNSPDLVEMITGFQEIIGDFSKWQKLLGEHKENQQKLTNFEHRITVLITEHNPAPIGNPLQ